MAENWILFYLA